MELHRESLSEFHLRVKMRPRRHKTKHRDCLHGAHGVNVFRRAMADAMAGTTAGAVAGAVAGVMTGAITGAISCAPCPDVITGGLQRLSSFINDTVI